MNATFALMQTELTLLRRNASAWSMATAIPFLLGAVWVISAPPFGEGWGAVTVLQVTMLLAFTLHTVGAMTLAARREQLVLKRWRSSQASATSVLVGSVGVLGGLVVGQAAVLTGFSVYMGGEAPASVAMLVVGLLAGVALTGALTFVVAAFTRSAEHATITTFPVFMLLVGSAAWALVRPFDAVDWAVLAVPGGGVAQLLRLGWDGPVGSASGVGAWFSQAAPALAVTVVFAVAAAVAAVRWFRWEPRG